MYKMVECVRSPVVILLAVDVAVSAEAGDLAVEALAAVRALEARGVPPPVDGLQVEPVGYPEAAARAHHTRNILGLRGRRGRRFQLRHRVQLLRRAGLLLLRVRMQMGMMVVMMVMVMVRGGLRRHAQIVGVLETSAVVPELLPTRWRTNKATRLLEMRAEGRKFEEQGWLRF